MSANTRHYPAYIGFCSLLGSIISLSSGTSIAKGFFPLIGAPGIMAYRLGFSALLLLLLWRPWRLNLNWQSFKIIVPYGLSLTVTNTLFYMSLNTLPLGLGLAIQFTGPLGLAIYTSRNKCDFLWVALALVGLGILLLPSITTLSVQSLDPIGVAYAFISGLTWVMYILFGRRTAQIHPGLATSVGFTVAAVVAIPLGFAYAGTALLDAHIALWGLGIAILSSTLPYSLEIIALRSLSTKTFSIMLSLDPAVGAMAGFLFLHELLSPAQALAIVCIVVASIGSTATNKNV